MQASWTTVLHLAAVEHEGMQRVPMLSYQVLHILIIFSSVYNGKSFLNESPHRPTLQPDRQSWYKYLE